MLGLFVVLLLAAFALLVGTAHAQDAVLMLSETRASQHPPGISLVAS